jgi:PPOX class probable F420-dependent enzyme
MSDEEVAAFLAERRTLICATNGPRGWPHVMPLWFVVRGEHLWAWTYAKSQKVRNLERDPRAALALEAGERYEELRGVTIEADVDLLRDLEAVLGLGVELMQRYGAVDSPGQLRDALRTQAPKRVALRFRPRRIASFDHRKLAGTS